LIFPAHSSPKATIDPSIIYPPTMDTLQIEHFKCPISLHIFADPVIAADGFIYERTAIQDWLSTHDYSPQTKEKMDTILISNKPMKSMVSELLDKHKELRNQQFTPTYSFLKNIEMVANIVIAKDFRKLLNIVEFNIEYTSIKNVAIFAIVLTQCNDTDVLLGCFIYRYIYLLYN